MFDNKTESTKHVQEMLITKLTSWKNHDINNEKEAFQYFYKDSEYLLKMFWQCRFDKMNADDKALNLWISENYLPLKYGFDKTKIPEPQLNNLDIGHEELTHIVLSAVWKDYLDSDLDNLVKPPKEKTSFLKRLFR